MSIELRHLRTFVAVVESGGFRRAAVHLYMSQPTVTAHVQALERAVGTPLLVRGFAAVEPTEAGRVLFHSAQAVLAEVEAGRRRAAEGVDRVADSLGASVLPAGTGAELTRPFLTELATRLRPTRLDCRPLEFRHWGTGIPDEVDVLLTREPLGPGWDVVTPLLEEELVVGMSTASAAGRGDVELAELDALPFARIAPELPPWIADFWSLRAERGQEPAHWSGPASWGPSELAERVAQGHGIGVGPAHLQRSTTPWGSSSGRWPGQGSVRVWCSRPGPATSARRWTRHTGTPPTSRRGSVRWSSPRARARTRSARSRASPPESGRSFITTSRHSIAQPVVTGCSSQRRSVSPRVSAATISWRR